MFDQSNKYIHNQDKPISVPSDVKLAKFQSFVNQMEHTNLELEERPIPFIVPEKFKLSHLYPKLFDAGSKIAEQ